MIRNDEMEPELHCVTEALSLQTPCMEIVAAASNSHDGLQIEVLEKEKVATNVLEEALVAMQKVLFDQDHEISILVKQVEFFRQGFASNSFMFDQGHFDAVAVFERPYIRSSEKYWKPIHLCILESKSRVIKSQMAGSSRTENDIKKLELLELKYVSRKDALYFRHAYPVYDAFIEFFYQASVPTSALENYWTWLLLLGSEYEVATLKEECEQYFKGNVDISGANIVEILDLGLTCGSRQIVRSAIDAHVGHHLLNLTEEPCRKLVEKFPQVRNLISQAESLHMGRRFAQQRPSV